jgi:hypothetical protein
MRSLRFDHIEPLIEQGISLVVKHGGPGSALVRGRPATTPHQRAFAVLGGLQTAVTMVTRSDLRVRPMSDVPYWPNTTREIAKGARGLGALEDAMQVFTLRTIPAIEEQIEGREAGRPWTEAADEVARASMLWFLESLRTGPDEKIPPFVGFGSVIALPARLGVSLWPDAGDG